ncbi:MAG: helix-turn-helix domain-containing protein [Pseudonocardiaceae bacterium]
MSYGHADNLARGGAQRGEHEQTPETTKADPPGGLPPDWYTAPDLKPVLAGRDIGALYRWLNAAGVVQRQIAVLTGSSQSEIADIMTGRRVRVMAYDVFERAAEGLAIPRERMGLSYWGPDGRYYGPPGAYPGGVPVIDAEGVAKMLRRHLIGLGGATLVGATVPGLGELLAELPGPGVPGELPSRLTGAHVAGVRDLSRRLGVGDTYCATDVLSGAAESVTQLLTVTGPEPVRRALLVAVAELHNQAGWAAFDAGLDRRALYHFARSLELAIEAKDTYLQVLALNYAGLVCVEHGHPDDGLKMTQCAQVKAWDIPSGDQRAVVVGETGKAALQACALEDSALALADMGDLDGAVVHLMQGREVWTPVPADPFGDMDRPAARLELARGRLDTAEQFAMASVRRWKGGRLISRTTSGLVLATVYVTAGDSRGLSVAHQAITDAGKLGSVRIRRQWVSPLADALEARRGSDYADLARTARQVATTRA